MNFGRIIVVLGIIQFTFINTSFAQTMEKGVDLSFIFGLNMGATTPVPLPDGLDIKKYNPKFNPKAGANIAYFFTERWGIGTGLTVDWKGMNVHTQVDDIHLSIDVPQLGTLTGYVSGKNKTKVNTFYLTQPVYGLFRINPKWQLKAGIYMAENLSRSFKGDVTDVDIVVESPVMQEYEVPYATLNYSGDTRKFDVGLLTGGEFIMNKHVGFFTEFTWGFIPYFSREVPIHFTMRNIYFTFGVSYRINK